MGDFTLMGCGPRDLALASGLVISAIAATGASAETPSMRFVSQPDLIRSINPEAIVLPSKSPAADRKAVVSQVQRGLPLSWPVTLTEAKEDRKSVV